jgi:hypothetical protein
MVGVDVLTVAVVTVKVCDVAPAGTNTEDGTPAAVLELESETVIPLVPAAVVRLTVPRAVWPPVTALGFTDTPPSAAGAGLTVRAKFLTPE